MKNYIHGLFILLSLCAVCLLPAEGESKDKGKKLNCKISLNIKRYPREGDIQLLNYYYTGIHKSYSEAVNTAMDTAEKKYKCDTEDYECEIEVVKRASSCQPAP